jgi:phosphatidylserine decarboxylase
MAKSLREWVTTDVQQVRDKPLKWLSESYFFRDPYRPTYSDTSYFFSPADGIILYQDVVAPDECILNIKGKSYSLQEALRDETYDKPSLVVGIFMTFFDVHVNRVPFPGRLSYRQLDPISTFNYPMLEIEKAILDDLHLSLVCMDYLRYNQRVINRVDSIQLGQSYYIIQIADYDVDSITPFELKQNQPYAQGQRFSQIRYGSQLELIIPLSTQYDFMTTQATEAHVEAGVDPLIAIRTKT